MVQTLGSMPFLFMVFFSTTFSPGAGVTGLKNMRYLFARYYLWCRVPGYENLMEGCPSSDELTPLSIFTGCLGAIIFLCALIVLYLKVWSDSLATSSIILPIAPDLLTFLFTRVLRLLFSTMIRESES